MKCIPKMTPDEKSKLSKCKQLLDEQITKLKVSLTKLQADIGCVADRTRKTEATIKDYFWKAIQYLLEEDRRLIQELNSYKEKQVYQLHAEIDEQFKLLTLYNDKLKFVEKALETEKLSSDSDILKDVTTISDTRVERPPHIKEPRFFCNQRKLIQTLKGIKHELTSLPILKYEISAKSDEDKTEADIRNKAVAEIDGTRITLACDWSNRSVKAVYKDKSGTKTKVLTTGGWPFGITVNVDDEVFVTDPVLRKIFKVCPYPQLRIMSSFTTEKMYCGLSNLDETTLVASGYVWLKSWASYWTVDVLDANGAILRTIRHKALENPEYICTTLTGDIIVSDKDAKALISFPSEDEENGGITVSDRCHQFPQGLCMADNGNILVVDTALNKVVEVTRSGDVHRDVLTLGDGIVSPRDVVLDERGLLLVACKDSIKVFTVD